MTTRKCEGRRGRLFGCLTAQRQRTVSPEPRPTIDIKKQSQELPAKDELPKKETPLFLAPRNCKVPVALVVYHASPNTGIQHINGLLQHVGSGIFHAGVAVHGREWSFSRKREFKPRDKLCDPCDPDTGISCGPPGRHPAHVYQKSVTLGEVDLTACEVHEIIKQVASEWKGRDYDLLTKNCCHFCSAFCQVLGVGPVPSEIMSLAEAGAKLRDGIRNVVYPLTAVALHLEALTAQEVKIETEQVGARHPAPSPQVVDKDHATC